MLAAVPIDRLASRSPSYLSSDSSTATSNMEKPKSTVEVVSTISTPTPSDSESTVKVEVKHKHKHTWAIVWCIYALWCTLVNNYGKSTGSSVLGIPQFRHDFGKPFDGNYVLPAYWQAAYYGAPQAA